MFILLDGNSLDNIIKSNDDTSIRFYGITQDPGTHSYIVHQDFHPGNILSDNFEISVKISDFGLSKQIGENRNNPEKKNIFGGLPYIAPEVLSDLTMKIYNGLRPKIPFLTPKLITRTIMRYWDARVTDRPTFKELHNEFRLLSFSNLPKPKNQENFEKELEELTKSTSVLSITDSGMMDLKV
ncbi:hypothetical protein Glove_624g40 [Diversispora epigaea]|uniref:Protein kinase domain-containing protein n=1 Tax=Diversispora epigaea TaxID=1348612 RepID=A0A397G5R3_9GLOM|nr:hypothetical protein Glove_624g40 [Diversispora epigaea]